MRIDELDVERYRNEREDARRTLELKMKDNADRRYNTSTRVVTGFVLAGFLGFLYFILAMCQVDPAVQIEKEKRKTEYDAKILMLQEKCQDEGRKWIDLNRCEED